MFKSLFKYAPSPLPHLPKNPFMWLFECGCHCLHHSACNQASSSLLFFSNFLFPSGEHPRLWLKLPPQSCAADAADALWLQGVLVGAEMRPCSSISTSRVLILAPVSWFGPCDSDHCSGQSHSCSIQPHHLPILTDYCIRTTKTKRNRKKNRPQNGVFPKEILNVTRISHQTGMVL